MFDLAQLIVFSIILCSHHLTSASLGDNLRYFHDCLNSCQYFNCSTRAAIENFHRRQSVVLKLLGWDCLAECKYDCQWETLNYLTSDEIGLSPSQVPQFYGKWTFRRVFGIQEPASAAFSVLNLVTNYLGWDSYRRRLMASGFSSFHDSYFIPITVNAFLGVNAWFWSSTFHIRDTPITEKLDYCSAFAVVLSSLYLAAIKVFEDRFNPFNKTSWFRTSLAVASVAFYVYHVHYLIYVLFDYGYNMKVNLVVGFCTFALWVAWCFLNYSPQRSKLFLKCVLCLVAVNLLLLLEVKDFPPVFDVFDAHSLWHLGTIPIPLVWYSFLAEEALSGKSSGK